MNDKNDYIEAAHQIIIALGLPRAQQNERSALSLLALLNLTPGKAWADAENPLVGITPIMDWAREHYGKEYAPNTRETFRRQTMHQFCDAGIALYNPDKPDRPVNSPKAVYQIEPAALALLRTFGTPAWHDSLTAYLAERETLVARYAKEREQNRIPVEIAPGKEITLSPGEHSELIRAIIEDFAPRFAPGSVLVYAGDTGDKWGYFDAPLLAGLGVDVDSHGKMPDVVLHFTAKNWLLLVESVTSRRPFLHARRVLVERATPDLERLANLRHRPIAGGHRLNRRDLLRGQGRASALAPPRPRRSKPRVRALHDQAPLELGQRREDMEHQTASGRAGFNPFRDALEADPGGFQLAHDLDQFGQRAPEAVEPPHDQDIPLSGIRQGFIQARPGRLRAAGRVGEHLFATGRRQGVPLQVHALIVGRYPRVTDLHVFVRLFDETGSL